MLNVLALMAGNLIGFALGLDGTRYLISQLFTTAEGALCGFSTLMLAGLRFLLIACFVLFTAVQLMMEYRAEELRNGISRKC